MTLLGIIMWIVFGGLAGWVAAVITRAEQQPAADVVIGIIGAVIGGYVMQAFGGSGVTGFNFYSLIVAIIGAVILLSIANLLRRGTGART